MSAGAAGWCQRVGVGYHGNGVKAALAFADCFENGDALGAHGKPVSGVLHVTAAKHSSGGRAERRANAKVSVGRVPMFPRLPCRRHQAFIFAHATASPHASKYPTL